MILTGITGGIILYPTLKAQALDEMANAVGAANGGGAANSLKVQFLAATGLKTLVGPTVTKTKKAIAGAKIVCCGGYLGANIVSNAAFFSPPVRIATSACCGISFLGISYLEWLESKSP